MAQARDRRATGNQVVIHVDQKVLFALLGLIGIVAIFFVGLTLGRVSSGASPQQTAVQAPLTSQPAQPLQVQQGQQPPPFAPGTDPNLLRPAGDDIPIGDNPRLAIPELVPLDFNWDFGDIRPDQAVEKVFTVKNTGTKPLEITKVTSS